MSQTYLTPEQVAERLLVRPRTVKDWLRAGTLRGVKAGRMWRIREEDLREFLHRQETPGTRGGTS